MVDPDLPFFSISIKISIAVQEHVAIPVYLEKFQYRIRRGLVVFIGLAAPIKTPLIGPPLRL
jgi:hypothetical protein